MCEYHFKTLSMKLHQYGGAHVHTIQIVLLRTEFGSVNVIDESILMTLLLTSIGSHWRVPSHAYLRERNS